MKNIQYFSMTACVLNQLLIVSAMIFYFRRFKEVITGRGFSYWFYYYTRLLCTLTQILLSLTFVLAWAIRLWIVLKFDPDLEKNIVKDDEPLLNNVTSLQIITGLEIFMFQVLIFHYTQVLYMMRLFTESYDDWIEKCKMKVSNL